MEDAVARNVRSSDGSSWCKICDRYVILMGLHTDGLKSTDMRCASARMVCTTPCTPLQLREAMAVMLVYSH